jgi:hypothetical protein
MDTKPFHAAGKVSSVETALTPDVSDMHDLTQVFNRGSFTGGYLSGKTGQELMCFEKPKNWGTFLGEARDADERDHHGCGARHGHGQSRHPA